MKKILIIDDDASALRILKDDISRIKTLAKAEVVAEASDKVTALKLMNNPQNHYDLVITDLHFRKEKGRALDGLEIIQAWKAKNLNNKVLVVTYDNENEWYNTVITLQKADGILSKNYDTVDLAAAINTILDKQMTYISPKLAQFLGEMNNGKTKTKKYSISEDAKTIIRLKLLGSTDEAVANQTNFSLGKVKKLLSNLYQLFGVSNFASLSKKLQELNIQIDS
jgi:DNA-binding NarL/FixJ family response regulator